MKYKNSRKEIVSTWLKGRDIVGENMSLRADLLAQKEDRKEIECVYQLPKRLGGKQLKWKLKSPSPLEIEEIEETSQIDLKDVHKLIRNQKKLYQYIKEKKI